MITLFISSSRSKFNKKFNHIYFEDTQSYDSIRWEQIMDNYDVDIAVQ